MADTGKPRKKAETSKFNNASRKISYEFYFNCTFTDKRRSFVNMEDKVKVGGRGLKIAEILKNANPGLRHNSRISTLPNVDGNLQATNPLPDGNLASVSDREVCGRGKILQAIKCHTKSTQVQNKLHTQSSAGLGRGDFLAELAKQIKIKEEKGFKYSYPLDELEESKKHEDTLTSVSPTHYEQKLQNKREHVPVIRKGEIGEKVAVTTNYIALKTDPEKSVFQYEVNFMPEIDFVAFRSKLVNQNFKFKRGIKCYDGGTLLYLPVKIANEKLVLEAKHPNENSLVTITIVFKRQMSLKECEQLYNILFFNCAKVLKFARLGKASYDFRQSHQIPQHKLELWPGYVTSVKEFDGGLLLCCDITHRILRTETACDVLSSIQKNNPSNYRTLAARELLGQCVLTRYNNNLYRIDDIDWNQTPMSKFKLSSSEEITFLEYYKRQYNINIANVKQPLLLSKSKVRRGNKDVQLICLVPEICHMTGLTDKMRNDVRVMKEISSYTKITPSQRQFAFKKFIENIRNNEHTKEMLKEWGLTIAEEPLEVLARILPSENIFFKNKVNISTSLHTYWGNCFKKYSLLHSIQVRNWILLHLNKNIQLANRFKEMVKKIAPGLGVDMLDPHMISLKTDKIDSYIQALKENVTSDTQLIVVLCPTPRIDRYSAIKKFSCRENPVPSQVINCSTIMRENVLASVIQNVVVQINCKLGGAPWTLNIPLKNCMVCGIDTFHEKTSNSVGGFVTSIDDDFTKWFSQTCIQKQKQELLDGLVYCFISSLRKYLSINKMLPDRIVIFRDGVGDGMLSYVQNHEVLQFLDACSLVNKEYKPKLSFVVVTKKINAKFYQCSSKTKDLYNPGTGCIVDHTITNRNYYDFFLVSQYVSYGTAMPSHYIVLYDNSGLKPDLMQRLTYKFCHLYYNYPGIVQVPAPCLYAHKLAYLVGQNLKGPASELLEDKLYYL